MDTFQIALVLIIHWLCTVGNDISHVLHIWSLTNVKDRVNILDTEECGALNMVIKNSTLADRNHSCLFSNFQSDQCNQDLSGTITMVVCVNSY